MSARLSMHGLQVAPELHRFIQDKVLPVFVRAAFCMLLVELMVKPLVSVTVPFVAVAV